MTVGGEIDRFIYSVDVGPDIRSSSTFATVSQGLMLNWGVGAGYLLLEDKALQLSAEALGSAVLEDAQERNINLEVLFGAKYRFLKMFQAGVAVGPGLTAGIGTPEAIRVPSVRAVRATVLFSMIFPRTF